MSFFIDLDYSNNILRRSLTRTAVTLSVPFRAEALAEPPRECSRESRPSPEAEARPKTKSDGGSPGGLAWPQTKVSVSWLVGLV